MKMNKYRAVNMHETEVWRGEAKNTYWAWQKLFVDLKYPSSEKVISKATDLGMRMEVWEIIVKGVKAEAD